MSNTSPQVGQPATDIDWLTADGRSASLAGLRGRWVILAFFPRDWDPARREHVAQYQAISKQVPGGAHLVGALGPGAWVESADPATSDARPFCNDASASNERNAERYGVTGMQGVFLIDAAGIVQWSHVAPPGVSPALASLLEAIDATPASGTVTRREFLMAAGALAIAAAVTPRLGRAAAAPAKPGKAGLARDADSTVLTVNGKQYTIDGDPRITLLDALRERIGLTGTKKSCDHGQCGACTVHLDDRRVNACLVLARQAEGRRVVTIEGLAQSGGLHPMQAAFIAHDGFQCGYCTSGQIMSAVACVREGHAGSRQQIQEWMSGNLCRCGAYPGICAAIEQGRQANA